MDYEEQRTTRELLELAEEMWESAGERFGDDDPQMTEWIIRKLARVYPRAVAEFVNSLELGEQ